MTGRARAALPSIVSLGLAGVMLGWALGRGVVIAYDMPWSPDPRWTPFVLGLDTPAPRAVPSDAVGVLLGLVAGAGLAQALVLLLVLAGAGAGAAALLRRLVPTVGVLPAVATAVFAVWNPFVVERLTVGQWTVLLGYAVLPWALRAALDARRGADVWPSAGLVALAGCGGANSLALVTLPTLLVVLLPPSRWRAVVAALVTAVSVGACWALPALVARAGGDRAGVSAFGPRSDMPLGLLASVLSGGGFWNAASWPESRSTLVTAVAAVVLAVVAAIAALGRFRAPGSGRAFVVAALVSLGVVLVSGLPVASGVWSAVVTGLPGGGILRDSQKFLAPWVVLLAVGAGLLVDWFRRRAAGSLGVLVLLVPVALLPTAVRGVGGRLVAVQVPEGYREVAATLSAAEPGLVGVLPWNQYRRYEWNGDRVSLTLIPRIVDQRTLYDDSLPLASGRVAGEDPRSAMVSAAVAGGTDPVSALRDAGVAYVAVEKGTGLVEPSIPADAVPVARSSDLDVYRFRDAVRTADGAPSTQVVAWVITLLAGLVHVTLAARRAVRTGRASYR